MTYIICFLLNRPQSDAFVQYILKKTKTMHCIHLSIRLYKCTFVKVHISNNIQDKSKIDQQAGRIHTSGFCLLSNHQNWVDSNAINHLLTECHSFLFAFLTENVVKKISKTDLGFVFCNRIFHYIFLKCIKKNCGNLISDVMW